MSHESFPLLKLLTRVVLAMLLACVVGVIATRQIGDFMQSPVVAFVVQGDNFHQHSIYILDLARNFTMSMTHGDTVNSSPTWSSDGHYLAYRCDTDICVLNWFTAETTRVHFALGDRILWSPDDRHLLITPTDLQLASVVRAIYVMDISAGIPDTSTVRYLGEGTEARWSPDGRQIVFSSSRDGGDREIYVSDWDGGNLRNLTQNTLPDYSPAWSPDGQSIAFSSNRATNDSTQQVYVIDLNGNLRSDIRFRYNAYSPVWLPDNSGIAFLSVTATACVYIIASTDETCFSPSTANHRDLAVSPDGRYFSMTVLRFPDYYTLLIDAENLGTRNRGRLGTNGIPAWMP